MSDNVRKTTVNVVPTMRYRDPEAAVDWLCKAFDFEPHLVVPGEGGGVVHAQLHFGNGLVMLGPAGDDEFGQLVKPPDATGGVGTQSVYVIVEDADTHHARAVGAGAEVVMKLEDQSHGGRGYSCRDPEGHVWNFGTYDPWETP